MPHVDFYILPDDQLPSLQQYACIRAEKHWLSGKRVLMQTDSAEHSLALNELLWNLREDSFIPHGIASLEPVDQQQPILISHQKIAETNFQRVINLSSRVSDITLSDNSTEQELQIEEILNQDEQRKQHGRQNYKKYRELNYTLEHHTLETVNG